MPRTERQHTLSEIRPYDRSRPRAPRKRRVVITGGTGKFGRWVAKEMFESGWEVIVADEVRPVPTLPASVPARYVYCDMRDYGQVIAVLSELDSSYRGVDAVVHLAAIPRPSAATNHCTFHTNTNSVYNILEACRVLGIHNIAIASSETIFGHPLYPEGPLSFPLTEEINLPNSSYSLGKLVGEVLAEHYCRWEPTMKVCSFRLSYVTEPDGYMEYKAWQDDPWPRAFNAFGYIDVRDGARAFRLALESGLVGAHVFNLANEDTAFLMPTQQLVEKCFPGVLYIPWSTNPREALLSTEKATRMLGYRPIHDWQSGLAAMEKKSQVNGAAPHLLLDTPESVPGKADYRRPY